MWTDDFLSYLALERNYSPRTVGEYRDDLDAFESYYKEMDGTLSWATIDEDVVRDWLVSMMEAGRAATTVNRRLSALRTFYKFLLKRGRVERDPVRDIQGPKKRKPLPVFVKEREMDRLLDGAFFGDGFSGKRDKLMLEMFYVTGIRLSELTGLDTCDVDRGRRVVKVTGKRNKQRVVPFGDELDALLEDYFAARDAAGAGRDGPMFVDGKGRRISSCRVRRTVQKYLGLVTTLKKRSPHVLRHTFATSMLNHDADLETLKELMGHESISTTEVYAHTTFEELKRMYNQAHPRA